MANNDQERHEDEPNYYVAPIPSYFSHVTVSSVIILSGMLFKWIVKESAGQTFYYLKPWEYMNTY